MTRAEAIATELTYHHTKPGPFCSCGHKFKLGEWISMHRAKRVELAIGLYEAGISIDDIHEAVETVSKFNANNQDA